MTYEQKKALKELMVLYPGASITEMNRVKCVETTTTTPAHSFHMVTALHKDVLLVLKSRDGFNQTLAQIIINTLLEESIMGDCISIFRSSELNKFGFNQVAVAPPPYSLCHGQSDYLSNLSYWAFPCHSCEIHGGFDPKEFSFFIGKGSRISVIDWQRKIVPQIRIRLVTEWPGGMLRKGRKFGLNPWDSTLHVLKNLPNRTIVEVSNSIGDVLKICPIDEEWRLSKPSGESDINIVVDTELEVAIGNFCQIPT